MPTSYTSLLGLALPVTGELSGTWGDTVNDYITRYVDASVAGTQIISGSQTAVTLTVTTATSLTQVGSGSSGSAQYAVINCTGNPAGLLTITAPASSRQYLIINATSTAQSVKIVGAGPTTGVTLVTGESAIVAWNGSDYVKVASSTADGVTTFSAGTTGFTPSTATSGAVTLAGTLATTNGGTGLTSFTANRVFYSSSTSAIGSSANLTFDGTTLTANDIIDSSLTASKPVFTNGSNNLVSTGTVPVDQGGTGATALTLNNVILGNGTSAVQFVAPGTNGNVLTSNGTTWSSAVLPAGGLTYIYTTTPITLTDKQGALADTSGGAFTITLPASPATGAQVVVADAGSNWGTNNLTVGRNGSTIGGLAENLVCDITGVSVQLVYDGTTWEVYAQVGGFGGTVQVANGGTGQTSYTNGQLLIGNSVGNTLTKATLTAGSGVSITNGNGSITISASSSYIPISTTYTAAVGDKILANTSAGSFTITLPASPATGQTVEFQDSFGTWGVNALTIGRNGNTIMGLAEDMVASNTNMGFGLVYNGSDWRIF
jgi:hypothetical protein